MADSVSLLLPTEYGDVPEYNTFLFFFYTVLIFKLFAVLLEIYKQTSS
jgi:hypothetical protein